jgi:RHS repeat-associated protein
MAATLIDQPRLAAPGQSLKLASGPSCRTVGASRRSRSRLRTSTGLLCARDRERASETVVARYYDPSTAQFLTRDPLEEITGQPYAYANDDPLDEVDPNGLCGTLGWVDGDCEAHAVVGGVENTVNSFTSCLDSNSAYDCAVMNFDPAYIAINGYYNEWQAAENGCSLGTIARYGAQGVLGVAGTAGIAVGGAGLAGGLVGDAADDEAVNVTFGHGARHLAGTGLDQSSVESAIESQVRASVSGADSTGSFWGRVSVNGQTVEYRAYTLTNGTINVGTYYVP